MAAVSREAERTEAGPSVAFWRDRTVLVTGATGLLGSWLVRALLGAGAHVVALVLDADPQSELVRRGDLGRVTVVSGGLEDAAALDRAVVGHEVDTVFHLAAQTLVGPAQRSPLATLEANVRGTYMLLDVCRRHGDRLSRVVVASSDKAYGSSPDLPYTEDTPLRGLNAYDVSKSCADMLTQAYQSSYGVPAVIARLGNIYGGGDLHWSRIVPGTIRSLLRQEAPVIRSDGTPVRDYIYVEDAVSAYLRLAEMATLPEVRGRAFNFSGQRAVSVLELVGAIRRLMGCEHIRPAVLGTAVGEIQDQYLSIERAAQVLGWAPRFDLDAGLTRTIGWYRDLLG
ncbi:MAG TPA: NAD-dependent epimerase/dehydratase family protein [Candidatus Dormibacteraeota bacterium]|nr:NAD-dependent epimerase/dehydratase family protein [Candidatus Dormibacteraeota bacterium]